MALIFFLIMDPLGNLSSYSYMVEHIPLKRQRWVVVREMLIALGAMLFFFFLGETIFQQLQLSEPSLHISAGLILFMVALKIIFISPTSLRANLAKEEPFIIPLAIPLTAGPALLATIMVYSLIEKDNLAMLAAIVLAWLLTSIIYSFATPIKRLLKTNGLLACERLIGMLLIILGVQRLLAGVELFSHKYLGS
jgi:multiple antibiotic resistance protein